MAHRHKPVVQLTFDPSLLAEIDALAGRRGRSRWIEDACRGVIDTKVLPIPGFPEDDELPKDDG